VEIIIDIALRSGSVFGGQHDLTASSHADKCDQEGQSLIG
jgi:hypothetical protein